MSWKRNILFKLLTLVLYRRFIFFSTWSSFDLSWKSTTSTCTRVKSYVASTSIIELQRWPLCDHLVIELYVIHPSTTTFACVTAAIPKISERRRELWVFRHFGNIYDEELPRVWAVKCRLSVSIIYQWQSFKSIIQFLQGRIDLEWHINPQ